MANKEPKVICTNFFKNDTAEKIKEEFNYKWIEVINFLESRTTNLQKHMN